MKIYFAAALAHATPEFRDEISKLKDALRDKFEIIDFFGFDPSADPKVIYNHDIEAVRSCDLVIAECTYPSTGVGLEIGTALSLNKKVLAIAKEKTLVSAMIRGNTNPLISIIYYKDYFEQ